NAIYEGPEYHGEHAAHLLVAGDNGGNNLPYLQYLHQKGADFHLPRAAGNFFRQSTVQYVSLIKCGGTVMAMSARLGNEILLRYFLETIKIDPDIIDEFGNTALHVLAWFGIATWEDARGDPPKEDIKGLSESGRGPWAVLTEYKAHIELPNLSNNTPFLLSLRRFESSMANLILDEIRKIEWLFGDTGAYKYPLSMIDNFAMNEDSDIEPTRINGNIISKNFFNRIWRGKHVTEEKTALEIVVGNKDLEALDRIPILRIVLEAKWHLYARDMFIFYFALAVLYQVIFLIDQVITPFGPLDSMDSNRVAFANSTTKLISKRLDYSTDGDKVRLTLEILLIVFNLISVFFEFLEMWRLGLKNYFLGGFNSFHNILQWFNIWVFTVAVILRLTGFPFYETLMFSILSITGWMQLLFFAKGIEGIGPLVIMVFRMFVEDLGKRFLPVFLVVVVAFAQAIWLLMAFFAQNDTNIQNSDVTVTSDPSIYRSSPVNNSTSFDFETTSKKYWGDMIRSFIHMFTQVAGAGEIDNLQNTEFPYIAVFLFVIYSILVSLLLQNVLIAMFNSTYTNIMEKSFQVWQIEWARLILEMDEKLTSSKLAFYGKRIGFSPRTGSKREKAERYMLLEFKKGKNIPENVITSDEHEQDIGEILRRSSAKRFAGPNKILEQESLSQKAMSGLRGQGRD
ncbi:hypothetical protein HK096_002558, partial [Nowakowskiella sp. JEL0078]